MIKKFDSSTALLIVDAQKGVNNTNYYGGPNGKRNNPNAEKNIISVLNKWRTSSRIIAFTKHNSREKNSPLKINLESGQQLDGIHPEDKDIVIIKDVNSGFVGTSLEIDLRREGIKRIVVLGFFTNVCVETTVRMSGNMGFDTYLVHDACAAMNSIGLNNKFFEPDLVHDMAVANLNGEFCTAISTSNALHLCDSDAEFLNRVQGNE